MGESPSNLAAIFLVGGRARRLAGAAKSELVVGGSTILERMLAACPDAARLVVGRRPPTADPLPDGVASVVEDPPGSGPAWAVAAGLGQVATGHPRVAILPGDLPFLTAEALTQLVSAADRAGGDAGAVYCDEAGRRQWLCGVWPTEAVRANAARAKPGDPARLLFAGIGTTTVHWDYSGPPPWFDCDTPEDLEQARAWAADLK
ncbi:molybdenum cofactor guanylyltransferase [Glycomyces xiaoerkulensis]|uniref:molybdenum cofactor guanylyltransferase n=1 Tax=Glycomyces xiaoerkulensis TaxID=2038139 RepID=UPI0018E48E19|nr:molybdenum cofactor guanylyltransferase [Glycomyces xiaoerkulensis]